MWISDPLAAFFTNSNQLSMDWELSHHAHGYYWTGATGTPREMLIAALTHPRAWGLRPISGCVVSDLNVI